MEYLAVDAGKEYPRNILPYPSFRLLFKVTDWFFVPEAPLSWVKSAPYPTEGAYNFRLFILSPKMINFLCFRSDCHRQSD